MFTETLPGFPECTIREQAGSISYCQWLATRPVCPTCGRPAVRDDQQTRELHDLPRAGQPHLLWIDTVRWSWGCPCQQSQRQPDPLENLVYRPPGEKTRARKVSRRLVDYLVEQWVKGHGLKELETECGLAARHIRSLVLGELSSRQHQSHYDVATRNPQFLSLDEVYWQRQAITLVIDNRPQLTGKTSFIPRVIDILPSREVPTLYTFFEELKAKQAQAGRPDWAPVIVSDMWHTFRQAIQLSFGGNAIHIADRFHVTQKIREDLTEAIQQILDEKQVEGKDTFQQLPLRFREARTGQHQASDKTSALPEWVDSLIQLAARLHSFWNLDYSQQEAINHYRAWRADVEAWPHQQGSEIKPFRRLTYLLDEQDWLLEVSNALVPETRPTVQGSTKPGRVMTTGRIERFNRQVGLLTHMHQRSPAASKNQKDWHEVEHFMAFRDRVLYSLNVPRQPITTLYARAILDRPTHCTCGAALGDAPPLQSRPRRAWDLPLASARVQLHWQCQEFRCPQCNRLIQSDLETEQGMTPRLSDHLCEVLKGDFNLTTLHRATGVSMSLLKDLRKQLVTADPVTISLPRQLAVLTFKWRGSRRLALFDVSNGRAVDLICAQEPYSDIRHSDITQLLTSEQASQVEYVWFHDYFWMPATFPKNRNITFVLDPFSRSLLLKRSLIRLQQAFTATLAPGVARLPWLRRYRTTFLRHPRAYHWRLLDRMEQERDRIYEQRDTLMETQPMVGFGLGRINALRILFEKALPPDDQDLDLWLNQTQLDFEQRLESAAAEQRQHLHKAWQALEPLIQALQPGSQIRQAILVGAQFSPHTVLTVQPRIRLANGKFPPKSKPPPANKQNLATVRREMAHLRSMEAFKAKGDLDSDWSRLRQAVQERGRR